LTDVGQRGVAKGVGTSRRRGELSRISSKGLQGVNQFVFLICMLMSCLLLFF